MEAMHTWEDIKLFTKECFKALLAFMTRIYFNASIFDGSQLIFQLF